MAMYEHFEDIHNLIKEQSLVAELIAMQSMSLTERVTGQKNVIDGTLMQTLTTLFVHTANYDEVKSEYKIRERQRAVNQQIEESVKRMQANRF